MCVTLTSGISTEASFTASAGYRGAEPTVRASSSRERRRPAGGVRLRGRDLGRATGTRLPMSYLHNVDTGQTTLVSEVQGEAAPPAQAGIRRRGRRPIRGLRLRRWGSRVRAPGSQPPAQSQPGRGLLLFDTLTHAVGRVSARGRNRRGGKSAPARRSTRRSASSNSRRDIRSTRAMSNTISIC